MCLSKQSCQMDDSSTNDISQDIFNATSACRSSLQSCLSIKPLAVNDWAENRLADFNLWAAGVGASAKTKASLDWRLHYQPEVRVVLVSLLITLRDYIEECKDRGLIESGSESRNATFGDSGESTSRDELSAEARQENLALAWFDALPSGSEDSDSSSTTSEDDETNKDIRPIEGAMQAMEDILDHLIRIGFAIRKSGTTSRLRKADKSFQQDNYKELKSHLTMALIAGAQDNSDNSTKTTDQRILDFENIYEDLTSERKHLIVANLRRRHRFNYARRHHKKLEEPADLNMFPMVKPVLEAIELPESAPGMERKRSSVNAKQPNPNPMKAPLSLAMSATTVSTIQGDILKAAAPSQASRRSRKHVAEDLCPYTCPFGDCPTEGTIYIARKDWKSHIFQNHGSSQNWQCLVCKDANRPDLFSDVDSFATHMRSIHQENTSEAQIESLIEMWCITVPPNIPVCPVCLRTEQSFDTINPVAMLDHIGDCIHGFSLRALPWVESTIEFDPKTAASIEERVRKWLNGAEEIEIGEESMRLKYMSSPFSLEMPCNLYVSGEYFADNSENSSRVERDSQLSDSALSTLSFHSTPGDPQSPPNEVEGNIDSYSDHKSELDPSDESSVPGEKDQVIIQPHPLAVGPRTESIESLQALLLYAARDGKATSVESILRTGRVDVNMANSFAETPLLVASGFGLHQVVKVCLHYGADVEGSDSLGRTPLSLAAGFGDFETAKLLIEHGASLHAKDQSGQTPLWRAACNQNFEIAGLLVSHGADVNTVNGEGLTLLNRVSGTEMKVFLRAQTDIKEL
ncbi:ankyrin repeat-containing protein [Fusarium mexicanum]|uniref:Ankyrin repeat-containing protein n=1 Tax=Fusarium mexicanum TaxID=751941 RepID=A0A8H5MNC8_9HYPO|nr:ankyrin repeat-containing protein [Fusarium mexicanum]